MEVLYVFLGFLLFVQLSEICLSFTALSQLGHKSACTWYKPAAVIIKGYSSLIWCNFGELTTKQNTETSDTSSRSDVMHRILYLIYIHRLTGSQLIVEHKASREC